MCFTHMFASACFKYFIYFQSYVAFCCKCFTLFGRGVRRGCADGPRGAQGASRRGCCGSGHVEDVLIPTLECRLHRELKREEEVRGRTGGRIDEAECTRGAGRAARTYGRTRPGASHVTIFIGHSRLLMGHPDYLLDFNEQA
jgi:hypothetical protein